MYIKLVDGLKSNASGFEYKIDEVNISNNWNPKTLDPKDMGGFNFTTDDKVLRWIHRGDTLYDVLIPDGAEVIDCPSENCPHGVFRTNKIIITNPRKVTEDMVLNFYKISKLPDKTYYQCIVVMLYRGYINIARKIIDDRVNEDNIDECINEFERFISDKHDGNTPVFNYDELFDDAKEIYNYLLDIKYR